MGVEDTCQLEVILKSKKNIVGKFYSWNAKCLLCSNLTLICLLAHFPGGSDGKESFCNAGDVGLIPQSERSPGKGNDNPLQYSCLGNPMDRGAWWATIHGVAESNTT